MSLNPFSMNGRSSRPALPVGSGRSFFVAPTSSVDLVSLGLVYPPGEDGQVRVWENDFASPLALMATGDTLFVLPGAYTVSTVLASALNDIKIVGLSDGRGRAILTGSAASILTLTGDGVEVTGLTFAIASTFKAITLTGADYCWIHDNVFTSAVGGTASHFIHMLTTACNYNVIEKNRFISNLVVSGAAVTMTSQITGLGIGNIIQDNHFVAGRVSTANAGAVTDGIVFVAAADTGNLVKNNSFTEFNGATFTAGVRTGASTVSGAAMILNNNFLLATAANAIVNTAGDAGFGNNVANGTV